MRSKKGAVELSMSTIIIIILGVTLLSLGLLWVRGTFSKITDISKSSFEQADAAISEIFQDVDSPLVISPPQISIPQGGADQVNVLITNEQADDAQFVAKVKSLDPGVLECSFADTKTGTSKTYSLPSGRQAKFGLIVDVKPEGKIGKLLVCDVEVTGLTGDTSEQLSVIVSKEKGLF